jgi:hypothetical protein
LSVVAKNSRAQMPQRDQPSDIALTCPTAWSLGIEESPA